MNKLLILLSLLIISCQKNDEIDDNELTINNVERIIEHLKNPSSNYVLVASHRGNWQIAPENSLESIKSCIDLGIDIVEIDVRKTFDGHLILMHDSDLDRTTNGSGKVSGKTLSEIKQLFLKDHRGNLTQQHVPTLEEAMQQAKGKIIVMIDKANDYFPEVFNVLSNTETVNQALFIEPYQYSEAISKMTRNLFNNCLYVPRIKENVDNKSGYTTPFINNNAAQAFEIRFSSTNSHTLEVIPSITEANTSIWMTSLSNDMVAGYTDQTSLINPDLGWGKCIEIGANIIMTDYPETLIKYLKNKKLHKS